MYSLERFEFTPDPVENADAVTIDSSILDKPQLLDAIARGLEFPDYFGKNWDALFDCLCDLSWLSRREAIIDHVTLPALPERDLRTYLECLLDAANDRAPDDVPKLRLVFRDRDRSRIAAALNAEAGEHVP